MQQKIEFLLGMDQDHSPESDEMQMRGKARKRINVRVLSSDNDETGAQETVLGNTLVSYPLPAGSNIVIGSKEYPKTRKVFYFVYNGAKAHQILQYDYSTNAVTLVLAEASAAPYYLNFNPDRPITGITIVELDADNHLLGWTDDYVNPNNPADYNEPKKLNIEKAILHSAGDYINGYPAPFEGRFITRVKQPPIFPPTYVWGQDSAQLINHLDKKFFEFKVQFTFDDKEVSPWSPYSPMAFPVTQNSGGSGEDLIYTSNKITITVPTGSGIVKRIRIAGRQWGLTDFSLIADLSKETLNIASNTTYDFPFFNDGNYVQLNVDESNALYSNVPRRAKAEEFTNGRLFWAKITENFDPVTIDMRLPLTYEVLSTPANSFFVNHSYLKSGGIYKYTLLYKDETGGRVGLANFTPGKSTEYISDKFGTTTYIPFLTDPLYGAPHLVPNTDMTYIPVVNTEIYNEPPDWAYSYQIARSKNEAMGRYFQFVAQDITYLDGNRAPTTTPADYVYIAMYMANITQRYLYENPNSRLVYDFVKGDRIRFIANNDVAGPVGGPWVPQASTQIAPFFAFNDSEVSSYDVSSQVAVIKMNANTPTTLIPGCLYEIYQPAENVINDQELVYEVAESGIITTDIHGNRVHSGVLANQLIVDFTSASSAVPFMTVTVAVGHGMVAGDKVKISATAYSIYGVVTSVTVTSILVDTTGFTLYGVFVGGAPGTITKAAEFKMTSGDCFRRYCDMPYIVGSPVYRLYSFIEASSASNVFLSNVTDYGRPNRIDPEIKQVTREAGMVWTELFEPETNINGLSTVYLDTNFQSLDARYGSIPLLVAKDIGLRVFQEFKCGLIPVDRILYGDLSLQQTIGVSNTVLNPQVDYYKGEYGIGQCPESHASDADVDYFIDPNKGCSIRLSTDGITVISDTGNMRNYFSDKCKAYIETGNIPKIFGVFDKKFGEYIIAFQDMLRPDPLGPIVAETLAWNEKYNQWSTFYTYYPEMMCMANTGIVTFQAGALYTHNTNPVYGNFYGVQYQPEFWVLGNAAPSNVKVLTAISEESNTIWEVYSITTPNGQETFLNASEFEIREHDCYAGVLKDINTPDVVLPLIEGDVMRDRTFLLKFRYPGTDYNKINAVNLYFIGSDLSNRN